MQKEHDSYFDDYRKIDVEEKEKYRKNQLGNMPFHIKFKESSADVLMFLMQRVRTSRQ